MRIPNKSLLCTIFSDKNMLALLVDVTESMWSTTDENIERLHGLIVRSTSDYFGHDEYLSICDKVAKLSGSVTRSDNGPRCRLVTRGCLPRKIFAMGCCGG